MPKRRFYNIITQHHTPQYPHLELQDDSMEVHSRMSSRRLLDNMHPFLPMARHAIEYSLINGSRDVHLDIDGDTIGRRLENTPGMVGFKSLMERTGINDYLFSESPRHGHTLYVPKAGHVVRLENGGALLPAVRKGELARAAFELVVAQTIHDALNP